MHHMRRAEELKLVPAYAGHSKSFNRCAMVDGAVGSVHTAMGLCELAAGGHIETHVQSFEESFYVVEGEPTLVLDGDAYTLLPGACGVIPIGLPHAWIGPKQGRARWIDMMAPMPRSDAERARHGDDIFFFGPPRDYALKTLDIRDPRSRHFFRMSENDIDVDKLKIGARADAPTVSASMSTALLAYSGIAVKMLVDQRLDAQTHTMFMVEYQAGGVAHPHDHPLEEAYYILEGEVEATADDKRYTLRAGDIFWTGVGCVHAFYNTAKGKVRWLETQSPQPPARHSYRFSRDWQYLTEKLAASAAASQSQAR